MLPQWWLQFDQRFLQSRAAAFAGRVGHARGLTPFLAGLESRLSEVLERAGWLERFLVRGAPHEGSLGFGYESSAYPEFNLLMLEEELDDMSEEVALGWLQRVAPAHPIARRLQKVARANRARAAAEAPTRKGGVPVAPPTVRATGRRGAKGASAVGASTVTRFATPGSPTALDVLEARSPDQPGRAPTARFPSSRVETGAREGLETPLAGSPFVDAAAAPNLSLAQELEPSVPSLSLDEVAEVPGAEALTGVLRSLLGPAAAEVEAGVTPRALLRALVSMRRDAGPSLPMAGVHRGASLSPSAAERVWVAAGDETEAPEDASARTAAALPRVAPRRASPSAADVRFAETLAMAPTLRSLAGLAATERAVLSPREVAAAQASTALQRAVSSNVVAPLAAVRQGSSVPVALGAETVSERAATARPGEDADATSRPVVRALSRPLPPVARRMLGASVLTALRSSPLLRSMLAEGDAQAGGLFDEAMFQQGSGRLVAGAFMESVAERFAPVSYAQATDAATLGAGVERESMFLSAGEEERVLLDGAEASDASEGARSTVLAARAGDRRGDRKRGERTRQGAAAPTAPTTKAPTTSRPATTPSRAASRTPRAPRALTSAAAVAPMPVLVQTLRQALEARGSMSSNLEAFAHLSEVIAEARAGLARPGVTARAVEARAADRGSVEGATTTAATAIPPTAGRRRAAKDMPIGFGSVMRSRGDLAKGDRSADADGDVTQAARPAGTSRAAVRLSGLSLDERGVPVVGRGGRSRVMAPLSDTLAMLAAGESEPLDVTSPAQAAATRVAERRAVEAVRAAIVAFEKRVSSGEAAQSRSGDAVVESTASVPVPPLPAGRKGKAPRATVATPAETNASPETNTAPGTNAPAETNVSARRTEAGAGSRQPESVVLAPDASGWASLASLARAATSDAPAETGALEAFVASLSARLGTTDRSPSALQAAVEAAWSTSQRATPAASFAAPSDASATPALAGTSRALAFGERVLSFSMPAVASGATRSPEGGPVSASYAGAGSTDELPFVLGEPESPDHEAAVSPLATVLARKQLAAALRAATSSSPSPLPPEASRRATELAARITSGRALSVAETRAIVAALESASVQVPTHTAKALRSGGGALAASPTVAASALARAEAWQTLPALRSLEATRATPRRSSTAATGIGVPAVAGSAGTESLRSPMAERVGESPALLGGNLRTWLGASEADSSAPAHVVPGLAGRVQALAGWNPVGGVMPSAGEAADALRLGAYPEAEIGEWLRLEGIESEPDVSRSAGAPGRRGRSATARGATRAVTTVDARGRSVQANALGPRAVRGVTADGERALSSLGPNLSRWLSPAPGLRGDKVSTTTPRGFEAGTGRAERSVAGDIGEWLRLDAERSAEVFESGVASATVRGRRGAKAAAPQVQVAAPFAGVVAENLALPMTERLERGAVAMSGGALSTETLGAEASASVLDVARLGGNVLDMVVLAGERPVEEAGEPGRVPAKSAKTMAVGGGLRGARNAAGAIRTGAEAQGETVRPLQAGRSSAFVPLDAPRVAGLRARLGGWLQGVYGDAAMAGALNRGRALEGFASLLLGGGTAAEAARAFSLLEGGSSLTFLDMAGEGSNPAIPPESATRGTPYRAGTRQPVGKRTEGGVGATVSGLSRTPASPVATEALGAYQAQASADRGAFVETPSAFRSEASAFFAETAEPAASGGSAVGPAAGLGLPLVNPVVNVVSQAASFSKASGPQAGGAAVREEVTTNVEHVSKGREDSEEELRKVLPELVEMLRRRMRTERERRGLL